MHIRLEGIDPLDAPPPPPPVANGLVVHIH